MQPTAGPSDPVKAFSLYATALNEGLQRLVQQFEQNRLVAGQKQDLSQEELDTVVDGLLERLPPYENAQEVTRVALEKALESAVVNLPSLVSGEWHDDEAHFALYFDLLDVVVTIVNRQSIEAQSAMLLLEVLLEVQSVQNAERIFGYLESRKERLTKDMIPGRGKALVILRTLNDLLRRLSKSTHTVFCGRILLFLASIFPLGERSGVNLRGEFNKENFTTFKVDEATAEDVSDQSTDETAEKDEDDDMVEDALVADKQKKKAEDASKDEGETKPEITVEAPEDGEELEESNKMDVDQAAKLADGKLDSPAQVADKKRGVAEPDFYTLFWSMQRFFSDPPSLFSSGVHPDLPPTLLPFVDSVPALPPLDKEGKVQSDVMTAGGTQNMTLLKAGVRKMLVVFNDASKREKELQGAAKDSKSSGKRGETQTKAASPEDVKHLFFYPKFLTSKALLDLEIADSSFRKQVMIQCLILFQYLHANTDAARLKQASLLKTPNKSVQPPYRLSEADNKWVTDLEARVFAEIARTPPDGETFVKTVKVVLQAERNWINWKANACQLFEKAPLDETQSHEAQTAKKKLEQPAPSFPYRVGTQALSQLWQSESKRIEDYVNTDRQRRLQGYFDAVKQQNALIKEKKEELAEFGKTDPAVLAADPDLQLLEERKASLAWRTLRIVSSTQLHLFSKIGVNDIEKLMEEMSKPAPILPIAQAKLKAVEPSEASDTGVKAEESQDSSAAADAPKAEDGAQAESSHAAAPTTDTAPPPDSQEDKKEVENKPDGGSGETPPAKDAPSETPDTAMAADAVEDATPAEPADAQQSTKRPRDEENMQVDPAGGIEGEQAKKQKVVE